MRPATPAVIAGAQPMEVGATSQTGPVIDTHVHLWMQPAVVPDGVRAAPPLLRQFLWEDLIGASAQLGDRQFVYVQVHPRRFDFTELEWLTGLDRPPNVLAGIIAYGQLDAGDFAAELDALIQVPLLCGVRQTIQHAPERRVCAGPEFIAGARRLAATGLTLDLLALPDQLEAVAELAEAVPNVRIVIEHMGKPAFWGPEAAWAAGIRRCARLANVYCKLSLGLHSASDRSPSRSWLATVPAHLVREFGGDRVLFGSNWPVSHALIEYQGWWEVVQEALRAGCTSAEVQRVLSGNARELYQGHAGRVNEGPGSSIGNAIT